jgi:predicted metal-dependent hydrolase
MLQLGLSFFEKGWNFLAPPEKKPPETPPKESLLWRHGLAVRLERRPRARRYLLRLQPDGTARLVIPRRGNRAEALRFLERQEAWLLERVAQWRRREAARGDWADGRRFLFRGEEVVLRVEHSSEGGIRLRFADQLLPVPDGTDYRAAVHACLRRLAASQLPTRTGELAREHGIVVRRVTVRAQKTRWGSCSAHGTISLNWRLIQAPVLVRDYLIVHELMHRREMNHSARYWKLVAEAFPEYRAAEAWLKRTRLEAMD